MTDVYLSQSDEQVRECIKLVTFETYDVIKKYIDSIEQYDKSKLYIITHKLCLHLNKTHIVECLIKDKVFPDADTVCTAITTAKFEYIKLCQQYMIPLDIMNSNGFTPIEVALSCYREHKTRNYYDLIIELNRASYLRNPKYWCICLDLHVYDDTSLSTNETRLITSIRNSSDIKKLNNCIVEYYISNNDIIKTTSYIKQYKDFIDDNELFEVISKYHAGDTLVKIHPLFKTNKMLNCCLKLRYYDIIISYRDIIDYEFITEIIKQTDHLSLVFIAEYLGFQVLKLKDTCDNTILHTLCSLCDCDATESKRNDMKYCFKIIMKHVFQLINMVNADGNTPLFSAHSNNVLMELMLMSGSDRHVKNKVGDTYIHHTIRYGTMTVLRKILLYDCRAINEQNNEGETPIVLAARLKHSDMCNELLYRNADATIADNHGNTIDHYICLHSLVSIKHQLDADRENKYGHTPADYMMEYLHNLTEKQNNQKID